jgi:hypothetical protein
MDNNIKVRFSENDYTGENPNIQNLEANNINTTPLEVIKQQPIQPPVVSTPKQNTGVQTYLGLSNEAGLIEIDLVTFREKGEQVRFLSIQVGGVGQDGQHQLAHINLDESAFNQIKGFFKQLEWNS